MKDRLQKLLLLLITVMVTLGVVEAMLRWFVPTQNGTSWMHRVPHPTRGWSLAAGVSYLNALPEATVPVSYSKAGWRDLDRKPNKPADKRRIVVLGDSFMEAYSVGLKDTFFRTLERHGVAAGAPVEVINLGVGGYGTLQQLLAFQEAGKDFKPDLVVLGFYLMNDLRENSHEISSLRYRGTDKLKVRPFLDPTSADWRVSKVDYDAALHRYEEKQQSRASVRTNWKNQFATTRLLEIAGKRFYGMAQKYYVPDLPAAERKAHYDERLSMELFSRGVHYCREPAEYMRSWETTERILERLKREVESIGGELLVFSVPAYEEVDPGYQQVVRSSILIPEVLCLQDAPGYTRLKQVTDELGLEYVNLLPAFRRAASQSGAPLFRSSDRHWNERGHAIAARSVADAVFIPGRFTIK